MLHIMLLVLKIIGIILAILTVLCVLILVVPFTYVGKGEFKEEARASLVARGLLSIVHFKFSVLGMDMRYVLRILGIPVIRGTIDIHQDEEAEDDINAGFSDVENGKGINKSKKVNAKNDTVAIDKYAGIIEIKEVDEERDEERDEESVSDSGDERDSFSSFIERVRKAIAKMKKLPVYIKNIKQKYRELKRFLKSKRTKIAFYYAKDILKKIYIHIKPSKLEAKIIFGFDSPDKTGQALGVLGLIYGTIKVNQEKFQVIPDFEKKILEGTVYMKGHFVLGYVVVQLFKLYFKKEVHDIIEKFNKERGGI